MRRVEFHRYGAAREVLLLNADAPVPEPGPGEMLIRVIASSVNPIDCAIRRGYGQTIFRSLGWAQFPIVTGRDVSGVVAKLGAGVNRFAPGDAVYTAPQNRGCAEFVTVRAENVARKPRNLTHAEAASLPYVALTTWAGLVTHARLGADSTRGQRVLIPRGAGGVGSFAIQLVKAWGGHVATVVGSGSIELVRSLGADDVIDRERDDFVQRLHDFDVVLDTLGHDDEPRLLETLKRHGGARFVTLITPRMPLTDRHGLEDGTRMAEAILATNKAAQQALGREYHWAFFRPDGAALEQVTRLVEAGFIRPVIDRVYPMEHIVEAHEYCETKRARGKIVITIARE
jgi:NADPH:quinone reductase-like Zn-dependent oxidoreductase